MVYNNYGTIAPIGSWKSRIEKCPARRILKKKTDRWYRQIAFDIIIEVLFFSLSTPVSSMSTTW